MKKHIDECAIVEAYKECRTCKAVAERIGCSDETVRRVLIKHSVPRVEHKSKKPRRPKRATREELEEIAEEYYKTDCTINDLAKKYHRSQYTISEGLKKYGTGIKWCEANAKKVTDDQILADIADGLTRPEIAEKHSINVATLDKRMHRLGVYAKHKVASTCLSNPETDEWHRTESGRKFVERHQPGFEYVSFKKGRYKLRCKTCGFVIERCKSTIRGKNCNCDRCKKEKEKEYELHQERIKLVRSFYAILEQKKPKKCLVCGGEFYSQYPDKRYCSDKCKRKAKGGSIRSRCRKYKSMYDPAVKPHLVIQRDKGVCQICGKKCDETDRRWGSFGPDSPTVDHIVPLAQGGAHTWDNVQCACALCNSYKRDLITA